MKNIPGAEFFIGNRQRLLAKTKSPLIVLTANGMLQKSGDNPYPFKQDTNFWYLSGINMPDIILVISAREEYLIIPSINSVRQAFDGAIDTDQITRTSGIRQVFDERSGWQKLNADLESLKGLATLMPSPLRLKHYDYFSQPSRRYLVSKLKRRKPRLEFEDLRPILARLRMVKQPIEIKLIQKAIDITTETLASVLESSSLNKFVTTGELEMAITDSFRSKAAQGHAFEPVVASGKKATTIHYISHNQSLKSGQLVVIDVGCEYAFYCSDIARTVIYGKPSDRQKAVFDSVKQVQTAALKLIKPGLDMRSFENDIELLIGEQLIKLGIIRKLDHKAIRRYYPHAVSHSLGLDPHDAADYSLPLPKNMVLTVEPGIYIPEEAIGVRLEDDVLITENGNQNLSKSLPSSLNL